MTTTNTSTTPSAARTADPAAKRADALAFVNNPHREVLRVAGVVDGMLNRGSYGCAVTEFLEGFDRLDALPANALYEWFAIAVESVVLTMTMLADEDDIDIPLELLESYRCMYLGCFGSDTGFTRLLLRSADLVRADNDVYAALMLFSITLTQRDEK